MGHNSTKNPFRRARLGLDVDTQQAVDEYRQRHGPDAAHDVGDALTILQGVEVAIFSAAMKCALAATIIVMASPARSDPSGHITGIGGIFVKSKDPKALALWYHDVLGLDVAPWGGAKLAYDAAGHPPAAAWAPFAQSTDHMAPSSREFMINFAIDDMDAMVARLAAHHVDVIQRDDANPFGRFTWILDPDGTKIELWQPK